jgi:hypothetical protein
MLFVGGNGVLSVVYMGITVLEVMARLAGFAGGDER